MWNPETSRKSSDISRCHCIIFAVFIRNVATTVNVEIPYTAKFNFGNMARLI